MQPVPADKPAEPQPQAQVIRLVLKPTHPPGTLYDWPCIFVPDSPSSVDVGAP